MDTITEIKSLFKKEQHFDLLVSRLAQASKQAEVKMSELGVTLDRSNPSETLVNLIEALNAVPQADRYKVELQIFGQHCLRFWYTVHDAMRTKAPKDVVAVPLLPLKTTVEPAKVTSELVAPVETVEAKETAFSVAEEEPLKPEPVKTQAKPAAKETAASVKAKGKK